MGRRSKLVAGKLGKDSSEIQIETNRKPNHLQEEMVNRNDKRRGRPEGERENTQRFIWVPRLMVC